MPATRRAVAGGVGCARGDGPAGGPHPNIDFALGVLAEAMRMVDGAGEAVFAVARSAGWIADGLEEYQHRLRYRIRATYTGPEVEVASPDRV